jgi:hypothetical protein
MRLCAGRILLSCIVCFTIVSQLALRTHAWEADVHYGLTRWLALKAGFAPEYADAIAYYAQQPDEEAYSEAVGVSFWYVIIQRNQSASENIGKLHFPNPRHVRPPSSPASVRSIPVGKLRVMSWSGFLKVARQRTIEFVSHLITNLFVSERRFILIRIRGLTKGLPIHRSGRTQATVGDTP